MAVLTLNEKLDQLGHRYEEMTQQLSTPEAVSDSARFQKLAKQHSELAEIVHKHREFKQIEKDLAGAHQMVLEAEDPEMKQMAHDEEKHLTERKEIVSASSSCCFCPRIPTTTRTSSSKFAPVPAATKPLFSPRNSSACIRATPKRKTGKWKSWRLLRLLWAD